MNYIFYIRRFINFEKREFISTKNQLFIIILGLTTLFVVSFFIPISFFSPFISMILSIIVGLIIASPCIFEPKRKKTKIIFNSILPVSYTERFLHLILKYIIIIPAICYIIYALAFYAYDHIFTDIQLLLIIKEIKTNLSIDLIYFLYSTQSIAMLGYFYFKKYPLFKIGAIYILYMGLIMLIIEFIYCHITHTPNIDILSGLLSPYAFAAEWIDTPSNILYLYEFVLKTILPIGIWVTIFFRQREIEL